MVLDVFGCDPERLEMHRLVANLEKTFQACGIAQTEYSIAKERDQAVCLMPSAEGWQLFSLENGEKQRLKTFGCLADACEAMMHEVAVDDEAENGMKQHFRKLQGRS